MGLLILAEETQKTLLVHKIRPEEGMYQRAEGAWRVLVVPRSAAGQRGACLITCARLNAGAAWPLAMQRPPS